MSVRFWKIVHSGGKIRAFRFFNSNIFKSKFETFITVIPRKTKWWIYIEHVKNFGAFLLKIFKKQFLLLPSLNALSAYTQLLIY